MSKDYSWYVDGAVKTKSPNYDSDAIHPDLVHAIFGIVTEAAEFMEGVDGRDTFFADRVNLKEEIGDICWYLGIAQKYYNDTGADVDIFNQEEYNIVQYHNDAFNMIDSAFKSQENSKIAYSLLTTKNNFNSNYNLKYRGNFIPVEARKNIINKVNSLHKYNPLAQWRANLLEQDIWSMTGIGINIAEFFENMKKPQSIIQKKF